MARFLYIPKIKDRTFFDKTFLHFSFRGDAWKLRDYSQGYEKEVLNQSSRYSVEDIRAMAVYDLPTPFHELTDVLFWHEATKKINEQYSIGKVVDEPPTPPTPQQPNLADIPHGEVRILGYSECGIINALFYEIQKSSNAVRLLEIFLSHAHFPFTSGLNTNIINAEFLIEQSFSDFGDADIILLLNTEQQKISIFAEAKVKTSQTTSWSIKDEFYKFSHGVRSHLDSSNLFTQLYHKLRMINSVRETGLTGIKEGVSFPLCSSKPIRKIGNNSVVLRAVTKVKDYLDRTYYLVLVPDRRAVVSDFFMNEFKSSNLSELPEWNVGNFGYLTWSDIMKFCTEHNLESTLRVFKFNEGQIYTE